MARLITSPIFQKGKYLSAFLFFVFAPYFFLEFGIDASNAGRLVMVPVFALLLLIGNKTFVLLAPRLLMYAGAFFAVMVGGLFFANANSEVFYETAKYLSFVVLSLAALNAWYNNKAEVVWALRIATSVVVVLLLIEVFPLIAQSRAAMYAFHPFTEHHNIIAAALLALCGLQAYSAATTAQLARWHSLLNLLVLVFICMLLQVRSVYLGLAAASIVFGTVSIQAKKYRQVLGSAVVLVTMAASYFLIDRAPSPGIQATSSIQSINSLQERLEFWKKTLQVIKDEPILGCGAGNWQFNYAKYSVNGIRNLEKGITVQHPHNEFLSIWAETGSLGLIVVLLVLLFLTRQFWYEYTRSKSGALLIIACTIIALACEAFFSFPKERLLCIFMMALLFALLANDLGLLRELPSRKKLISKVLVLLALLLIQSIAFLRLKGEYYTKELLRFQSINDPRGMLKAGAAAESFVYSSDPTSSPIAGYLGAAYYALNRPDSMVMQCQRALEIAPYDYESLSNLGFALTRYGDKNEARRILTEALRINAKYDGAWLNLAILDYSLRKYEDAYHEILQIENVQEKYPEQLGAIQAALQQHLMEQ